MSIIKSLHTSSTEDRFNSPIISKQEQKANASYLYVFCLYYVIRSRGFKGLYIIVQFFDVLCDFSLQRR